MHDEDEGKVQVEEVDPEKEPERAELILPTGMKGPPPGSKFALVRLTTRFHGNEKRGDIVLIMWGLSFREERLADRRAKGEASDMAYNRFGGTVRAIDGVPVDRSTGAGEKQTDQLLEDAGQKGRQLLLNAFVRLFGVTEEESADFFEQVRSGVTG